MTDGTLQGLKVAILATDGFEQVELTEPRKALEQAGAETRVISPKKGELRGWKFTDWGQTVPVDLVLDQARPQDFDAVMLPGGVINPDKLRMEPKAVPSSRRSSMRVNRSRRSAMDPGWLSKPTRRAAGA